MIQRAIRIAPSILSADFGCLGSQVRDAEAGGADIIHIDVMDGHFVPNITIGPLVVRALRPITVLPLHVHLMIEKPERYIDAFCDAGADLISVHVETCPHLHRTLQQIREAGAKSSVVLNPATPAAALDQVLDMVDLVLVMTVNPGFGGQKLIPSCLCKVRALRDRLDQVNPDCSLEVDGGVNMETLSAVLASGADTLVMGSAVFGAKDGAKQAIGDYRKAIERLAVA